MLVSLGIASPVTKASAGALYHRQLSRQLADWLPAALARAGGILALPDVFCLFNRARGAELVSPEDVLKACQLWQSLGITNVQFRRFDSGVLVAHAADRSDDEACAALASFGSKTSRMDAFAASGRLGAKRARDGGYAFRSLVRAGVPLAFGTDWPIVADANPFATMRAAVARHEANASDAARPWDAAQALSPRCLLYTSPSPRD